MKILILDSAGRYINIYLNNFIDMIIIDTLT